MKITYDPTVDALYIRFIEGRVESHVIQLNDQVAVDIGPGEQVGSKSWTRANFLRDCAKERSRSKTLQPPE